MTRSRRASISTSVVDLQQQIEQHGNRESEVSGIMSQLKDRTDELMRSVAEARNYKLQLEAVKKELKEERAASAAATASAGGGPGHVLSNGASTERHSSTALALPDAERPAKGPHELDAIFMLAQSFEASLRPSEWTDNNVAGWLLTQMPFVGPRYFLTFRDKGVNGAMLLELDENDIKEALGVHDGIHRKRVMLEIAKLRSADKDWNLRSVGSESE